MIYLVGGAGYIGSGLQAYLSAASLKYVVVDPTVEPGPHVRQELGSAISAVVRDEDVVVWMAGPRNAQAPAAVQCAAALVESDWRHFLGGLWSSPRIILFSSMSVHDWPENPYSVHKIRMETLPNLDDRRVNIVRPGTVVGLSGPEKTLRADLGVHAVLRRLLNGESAWINATCVRAYVALPRLLGRVRDLIVQKGPLPAVDEVYSTITSMAAVLAPALERWSPKLSLREDAGAPSVAVLRSGTVCPFGLKELHTEVGRIIDRGRYTTYI